MLQRKPSPVVGLEFYNRNPRKLSLWLEACCEEIELLADYEYRLESIETEYRFEIEEDLMVLYYQGEFGPKILRRPCSKEPRNPLQWELVADYTV